MGIFHSRKNRQKITALVFSGALVLTGCASIFTDVADITPTAAIATPPAAAAEIPVETIGPRFDDRAPHEWGVRKPWHYAIHGVDVSRYQQQINWQKLRQNNIDFAFIKATEGGDRLDTYFKDNWQQAKAAGMARGAYHFYYFCRPAREQAKWFIRHVPRDNSALPPVLDIEWNHTSPSCKRRPPADVVRGEMLVFLTILERHYGKRPIIYTTVDFFEHNALGQLRQYPFWLRSVAGHPEEKYGDHPWVFWQYTGTGTVPGITGDTDINVFAGTTADWQTWLQGQRQ